ncbi:MAG TPA: VWA domain-containing protein [Casimicrobiaceae bacterium]|nr:VWA domain-containing protein [Casimicrobiaceae bacterium]
MKFIWPQWLWLAAILPVLIALYVWMLRRRQKRALRYASLAIVNEALGKASRLRRHIPPALMLLSLGALIVATARPTATVTLPSEHETIILAMDVSGSMRATDVQPTRIEAAQAAAKSFIHDAPANTRIGIVAFAGTASVVQPATLSREDLDAAIDRFELQRATAVGSGILVSLKMLFPDIEYNLNSYNPRGDPRRGTAIGEAKTDAVPWKPVEPGTYRAGAIILLTDGQTTTGPDPREAAKMAAERGVRVFTVGVGTTQGEIIGSEGWSMRVRLDEDALKAIAETTHGDYFFAGSGPDLKKVYQDLNSKLVLEKKETEVTALFAALAAFLTLCAVGLSMWWYQRVL